MTQTTPLKHVPPGAIGHNRGIVRRNYAFLPPEGVLQSRLPHYAGTVVRFLAAPSLGAKFVQFVLEIAPGGGTPVSGSGKAAADEECRTKSIFRACSNASSRSSF